MIPSVRPHDVTLAVGAALVLAVVASLAFSSLARPADQQARLARLETRVAEAERLGRGAATPRGARRGAICTVQATDEAPALRGRLQAAATEAGLAIGALDVAALGEPLPGELGVLQVRLTAEGPYDGAFQLLNRLDQAQPQLFAHTVDLVSKGDTVTLSFVGRAFCVS